VLHWPFVNSNAKIPSDLNDVLFSGWGVSMSTIAPHVRKHLSVDALLALVRSGFAAIPEPRRDHRDISLTDALMSAFAMFSLKAPALLAFDKERAEGNLHTIYARLYPITPHSKALQ
jgi:hypothetical protein